MEILLGGLAVAVIYSFMSLRVLRQYERGVAFFLGRYWGTKGPGLIFLPAGFAGQKRVASSPSTSRRRTSSPATTCR